ncbi:MAG: nuclear transport factor 2 family protein [Acidimicrobiia bacterium]|nr:nuclear transport factor 2 family protein [Acidimicrobiia bacterium]
MAAENNKEAVRRIFQGKANMFDFFAEDVRWTIPGSTRYSRTYDGIRDLLEGQFGPLSKQMATTGPYEMVDLIAEDDFVVAQLNSTGNTTISGASYNNRHCMVIRFEAGLIVEVTQYCDTELITSALG